MVITIEFSLLTLHSFVSIGLIAFGSYAMLTFETEVQDLRSVLKLSSK